AIKNFEVGIAGALRVGDGGHIFAEIIEAGHHARAVALFGGGQSFFERFAGDEAVRHPLGGGVGGYPVGETLGLGELQKRRSEHGNMIMALLWLRQWEFVRCDYEAVTGSEAFAGCWEAASKP